MKVLVGMQCEVDHNDEHYDMMIAFGRGCLLALGPPSSLNLFFSRNAFTFQLSIVLMSTFPLKPTHPNQCIITGRLCSISEFEQVLVAKDGDGFSKKCQRGIGRKCGSDDDGKDSGNLKFLQGHIFVSICSGDYLHSDGLLLDDRRQCVRLLPEARKDGISVFEKRLIIAEGKSELEKRQVFFMAAHGQKFACDELVIKGEKITVKS